LQLLESGIVPQIAKRGEDGAGEIPVRAAKGGDTKCILQRLRAVGEKLGHFGCSVEEIGLARALFCGQTGKLRVQVDGAQHPVQVEIVTLHEQGARSGDRRNSHLPRQRERLVQCVPRRKLDEQPLAGTPLERGEEPAVVA
jgi:hypothetical protein